LYDALGSGVSAELVDTVYSSITGVLPAFGSPERIAIDVAVSLPSMLHEAFTTDDGFCSTRRFWHT
jgi:hypothetical protein